MFGFKKLLVGVDGIPSEEPPHELVLPDPTREAVNLALRVAESSRTDVTFLSVLEEASGEDETAASKLLESLVAQAAARNITSHANIVSGRPWMEIIRQVQRSGHQMVMVGSRELSPARRLVLGSTGTKLLRKCPCPVWVVQPEDRDDVRTVLVADDFTSVGQRCLDLGVSAARLLDARLLVLHALQYPYRGPLRHTGASDEQIEDYRKKTRDEAEKLLNDRLSMTDHRTISQGVRAEVIDGPPESVIEQALDEHAADLLVMGTIARGGIPGLLVGNTAERLLPVINCSILAVKPDDFVSPVQPGGNA